MKSRRYSLVFGVVSLLAILCVIPVLASRRTNSTFADLAMLGHVPDFSFTDQSGKTFTLADMKGKVCVVDFFLSSCKGACPIMAANMYKLQEAYKDNTKVCFVSISVDPDTDTPAVLKEHAKNLNADPNQWHFLSGPIKTVQLLEGVNGLKVGIPDTPMAHSQRFILIDGDGNIRMFYDAMEDADVARVKSDIKVLLAESA